MKKVIDINNISKSFNGKLILKNISFSLKKNESIAIIGKSGSGKSVLLKCIIGLLKPNNGSIKIFGKDIVKCTRKEKEQTLLNFGVTFQNGALFDSLTIWENIVFRISKTQNFSKQKSISIANTVLNNVGLDKSVSYQYPSELSGGMQKRVAIARAICDNPPILLFDEPTSGLDPITGSLIDDLIRDTVNRLGVSTITITHDMNSVFKYANKVILISNNVIDWIGTPEDMKKSKNTTIKEFIHNNKSSSA